MPPTPTRGSLGTSASRHAQPPGEKTLHQRHQPVLVPAKVALVRNRKTSGIPPVAKGVDPAPPAQEVQARRPGTYR